MAGRKTKQGDTTPEAFMPVGAGGMPDALACIVVIYGAELGRRATLGRGIFELGRSSKSDLSLDEESVSRHHARITHADDGYRIEDLGSTNGTQVNDVKVTAPVLLKHGNQIKVGRSILKFMGENVDSNYHEEIYRLMTVDGLTQAYNKRYFNEVLEREFNRSGRYQRELSLVLFDIDDFKAINAAHGNLAGDAALRQLAAAIKGKLRQQDIFARVGGEEFGVLLPEVSADAARLIAEKIRKIAEATTMTYEEKSFRCTVSLGIASFHAKLESAEALYKAAATKLTEAKSAGRNRTC